MAKRYRKKPVEVRAWQYQWEGHPAPDWMVAAITAGTITLGPAGWLCETRSGVQLALVGDWLIEGVDGEIYPCSNDVFQQTYEEVSP